MRSSIFVVIALAVACAHETPRGETPSGAASASGSVSAAGDGVAGGGAAGPSGSAGPAARTLPKFDQTCAADADCVVLTDEIVDQPPNFACCAGCTQRAGNRGWYSKFQAACAAWPAPQCPAIGCALPVVTATCVSHKCEIKTK